MYITSNTAWCMTQGTYLLSYVCASCHALSVFMQGKSNTLFEPSNKTAAKWNS